MTASTFWRCTRSRNSLTCLVVPPASSRKTSSIGAPPMPLAVGARDLAGVQGLGQHLGAVAGRDAEGAGRGAGEEGDHADLDRRLRPGAGGGERSRGSGQQMHERSCHDSSLLDRG